MKKRSFFIFLFVFTLCISSLYGCSHNIGPKNDPSDNSTKADVPIGHGANEKYEYDEYEDHIVLTACLTDESVVWLPSTIANKPVTGFGTIFSKNFKLMSINITGNVEAIEDRAFYMCDHLTTVNVFDGLKSIGKEAFAGCSSLSVAKIPASVTHIADDAFLYCLNLVIFGEEGSAIQEYANRFQSINFRPVEHETTAVAEEDSSQAQPEESSVTTTVPETSAQAPTTAPPTTEAPTAPPTEPPTEAPTEPPATEPPAEPDTTSAENEIPDDQIEV